MGIYAPKLNRDTAIWFALVCALFSGSASADEIDPMHLCIGTIRTVISFQRLREPEERAHFGSWMGMAHSHVDAISAFAREQGRYLVFRASNSEGVPHQGKPKHAFKPEECKLKTARDGHNAGYVAIPTAESFHSPAILREAREIWHRAWSELKKKGYRLSEDGRVLDPQENFLIPDYDLEGVYNQNGNIVHFGDGENVDPEATKLLRALNRAIVGGATDPAYHPVQHGGQDEWLKGGKKPKPPLGVFEPGGTLVMLRTEEEIDRYYQNHFFNPVWNPLHPAHTN